MFTPTGWVPNGQLPLDQVATTSYAPTNALAGLARPLRGGTDKNQVRGNMGRPGNFDRRMDPGFVGNPSALSAMQGGWPAEWQSQIQDWRSQRPMPVPGQGQPVDWRAQIQDWRAQAPDFRSYFPGF